MFKPHLLPMNMPVTRLAHYANAADVNTVIVNGEIVINQGEFTGKTPGTMITNFNS